MRPRVKGVLFDIGGVLYVGESPVKGAAEAVRRIKEHFPVRFLTNTTRMLPETIYEKLRGFGFEIEREEIFTALDATESYVRKHNGSVYPLLTDEAERYFDALRSDTPDYVVVGDAHHNFTYERMNEAFRALMNGATLIAAAKNKYFKEDDALSMDAGGFVAALEYAADTKAMLIGKPSRDFFHLAVDAMGLQPREVVMVGDDIESDIKGAQDAGLPTALVKTGKFRPADLKKGIRPDYLFSDITDLVGILD